MSKNIDQRVVEMRFDNSNFEKNTKQTLSTLESLKKSLNFDRDTKSLEKLQSSAKQVNFSNMENSLEAVRVKFSALEVIAMTVLANMTNTAINAGKRMIHALTIKMPMDGFREYELQINSTQTIMANTGRTVEDVNKALDSLNEYADLTIYNFAEMTHNAGMFTAAGLGLEDTMVALKGVGNWAAYAGANSQQMANATYQLGQALNAGAIRLQDWMSIEKSAGMAGKKYKDAFIETAREMNTGVDTAIKKHGDFRSSLREGWLTTEVFLKTMQKFADDNSMTDAATKVKRFSQMIDTLKEAIGTGWATTWRTLIGDFEEAKSMFTDFTKVFSRIIETSADMRNSVLKDWKALGGRKALLDSFINLFNTIASVVVPVKKAFEDIFPRAKATDLVYWTTVLRSFTEKMVLTTEKSDKLKRTFKGLFSVLDIGKQFLFSVLKLLKPIINVLGLLSDKLLTGTAILGDYVYKADEFIKNSNIFNNIFENLSNGIGGFISLLSRLKDFLYNLTFKDIKLKPDFSGFENIENIATKLRNVLSGLKEFIYNTIEDINSNVRRISFVEILKKGAEIIASIIDKLLGYLYVITTEVKNFIKDITFKDLLEAGVLGSFVLFIKGLVSGSNTISNIFTKISESFTSLADIFKSSNEVINNVSGMLDGVKGALQGFQNDLNAKALIKISIAIGILILSLKLLATINTDKLVGSILAVTILFGELIGTLYSFSKMDAKVLKNTNKTIFTMVGLSVTIAILAASLKNISSLSFKEMTTGLLGVIALMGILVVTIKKLSEFETKAVKGVFSLVILAIAIRTLAKAVTYLSTLDFVQLSKGLVGVGVLLTELALFQKFSGKSVGFNNGVGLLLLAFAIGNLAKSVQIFGNMDITTVKQGVMSLGLVLAELAVFSKMSSGSKGLIGIGIGLILVGNSMKSFTTAVSELGNLSVEQITKGLIAMAVILVELTVAVRMMPKNLPIIGVGLIAISSAMSRLSESLVTLSNLSIEQITKGLIAMGVILAELTVAVNMMPKTLPLIGVGLMIIASAIASLSKSLIVLGNISIDGLKKALMGIGIILLELTLALNAARGTLSGAASISLLAISLGLLIPILIALGSVPISVLVKSISALAAIFVVFGVAAFALAPVLPLMLGLSGVLLVLGAAVGVFGAGILAIGAGITSLAVGISSLIVLGAEASRVIIETITAIITGIINSLPMIISGISDTLKGILQLIIDNMPLIIEAFLAIISGLLTALEQSVPRIIELIINTLITILDKLVEYTPKIVDSVTDIVVKIIDGISGNINKIIDAGVTLMLSFIQGITSQTLRLVQEAINIVIAFINGIAETIDKEGPRLREAVSNLVTSIINFILETIGSFFIPILNRGKELFGSFLDGIGEKIKDISPAIKEFIDSILSKIGEFKDAFVQKGKDIISGFIDGILGKKKDVENSVTEISNAVVDQSKKTLDEHSPSKKTEKVGEYAGEGLAKGITNTKDKVIKASDDVGKGILDSFDTSAKDLLKNQNKTDDELLDSKKDYYSELLGVNTSNNEQIQYESKSNAEIETSINESRIESGNKLVSSKKSQQEELLKNEDIYWGLLLETLRKGAEAEKYENMKISDFKKEILTETKKLLDDYTNALNSNTDSLMNRANIFKAVSEKESVNSSDLIDNLEAQINEMQTYTAVMTSLNERLADTPLKEAISQMGVDSIEELKALNSMTDLELSGYVKLYDEKYALCQNAATVQLEAMKTETEKKLSEIYGGVNINFDKFKESFDGTFNSISSYVSKSVEIGKQLSDGVGVGITQGSENTNKAAVKMIEDTKEAARNYAQIHSPSKLFGDEVGKYIPEGIAVGISENEEPVLNASQKLNDSILHIFTDNLEKYKEVGINMSDNYQNGLSSSVETTFGLISEKIKTILDNTTVIIESYNNSFRTKAEYLVEALVKGIENKKKSFGDVIKSLLEEFTVNIQTADTHSTLEMEKLLLSLTTSIKNKFNDFESLGSEIMVKFIAGIKNKDLDTKQIFINIISEVISTLRDKYQDFYGLGVNVATGFMEGIKSKAYEISEEARRIAREAIESVEDELDSHSPSRELEKRGKWFDEGFALGIKNNSKTVDVSARTVANSAVNTISKTISTLAKAINSDIDYEPTIRPVLDLTNITSGAGKINTLLSRNNAYAISSNLSGIRDFERESHVKAGNVYQFTQNNYSPKSLSRIDIYRQTRNQFSEIERLANI